MKNKLNTVVALALANGVLSALSAKREKYRDQLVEEGNKMIDEKAIKAIDDKINGLQRQRKDLINRATKNTSGFKRYVEYGTRVKVTFNNNLPDPKDLRDELIVAVNLHGKSIEQAKADLLKKY